MYEEFFGFREPPFRITPDPRVLYHNRCYDEAIAALAYGIDQRKGFMSLVGEVGTGKTTLLRHLLETVAPNVRTVLLLYPTITFEEMLEQILLELGVPLAATTKGIMLQRLHEYLLEHTRGGGNVALLFDEAQALDARTLEELRLISNFETGTEKIVQIVLAGQPEFEEKLRRAEHRQLRQRIALHVRLRPLNTDEVADYVRVRLEHVDAPDPGVFTPGAIARIARLTTGVPRIVNVLCDACCTTAFALGQRQITEAIVDETWADYAGLAGELAPAPSDTPFVPPTPPAETERAWEPALEPPPVLTPPPPPPPAPRARAAAEVPPIPAPQFAAPPSAPADDSPADEPQQPSEPPPPDDLGPPDEEPAEERWPMFVAFALGVVLAAIVLMQLGRRVQPTPDLPEPVPAPGAALSTPPTIPETIPPSLSDTPPTPPAAAPERGNPAPGDAAPTAVDALDVVDDFRRAYEQRNIEHLAALFAPDAHKGDLAGRDAIVADYRRFFANARDLLYSQPSAAVEPHGDHVVVRAPFEITYTDAADRDIEVRGTAAWTVVRRDGTTLIRSLDFELTPVTQ